MKFFLRSYDMLTDTNKKMFIQIGFFTLQDIIDKAHEKWPNVKLEDIHIEIECIEENNTSYHGLKNVKVCTEYYVLSIE
ncbi:hypothetical protein RCIP0023_00117 [Klebsiella phage RCIP0023]